MTQHDKTAVMLSLDALQTLAASVADELARQAGSDQRTLPADLRRRFIEVRAGLFMLGIYDPVLVRFDSATAPPAPVSEIAAQLARWAGSAT